MIDLLRKLSNDELKQIFTMHPYSERVIDIIEEEYKLAETRDDLALFVIRDDAFRLFWNRRLNDVEMLSDDDFNELLSSHTFPSSHSLIGEAIIAGRLSSKQCQSYLADSKPRNKWTSLQATCFLNLQRICKLTEVSKRELHWNEVKQLLSCLLDNKTVWALEVAINRLNHEGLQEFIDVCEDSSMLSRRNKRYLVSLAKRKMRR